jgi:protein-disulfide isomerase
MVLTRRRLLLASGSVAVAGLGGCLGVGGGEGEDDGAGSGESTAEGGNASGSGGTATPVASAPIPADPTAFTYARMGTADRPAVTYVGNWKCPYCAAFDAGILGDVVTGYVEPGRLALTYRALAFVGGEPFLGPDAPRAARAGLAVWDLAPGRYWPYHERVMADQPPETERWATPDRLVEFAAAAGVPDPDRLRDRLDDAHLRRAVERTSAAAADLGITGTPALVVDGRVVNPFANRDLDPNPRLFELLDSAAP